VRWLWDSRPKERDIMRQPPHLTLVEKPKINGNRLLKALSDEDQALLHSSLVLVTLKRGDVMIRPNEPIEHVYFPVDSLGSIVALTPDNRRIEVGLFGRDGMSSTSLLHGTNVTPHETFTQVEGTALRTTAEDLRHAIRRSPTLHELLLRYVEAFQVQVAFTALSHGSFTIEERLARWLLMCHDRLPGDDLPLVHEFLSMMLGVRRSGVTIAIQLLEGTGAIRATRGHIVLRDRAKLEEAANGSYGVPEAEYRRLIGDW
jgi:CRP-like cAMP-binding protein